MDESNDTLTLDDYPLDDDYCDVEAGRADVSTSDEAAETDTIDRTARSADRTYLLDTGEGASASGIIDDRIDADSPVSNDGRSETVTTFYPWDGPAEKKDQYARLAKLNDGMRAPSRNGQNKIADRNRWLDCIASTLDMTSYQQARSRSVAEEVNMKHMAHYSTEKVLLGIVSLVCNADGRWIRDEDVFRQLLEDHGSDLDELKSVRSLVRRKTSL